MLEIRPNCEYCDKDLAPDAADAMICTYECTFCADCVMTHLKNVCPNCGGGFEKRPIRPKAARRAGVSLEHQPASQTRVLIKYDKDYIADFAETYRAIPPGKR